MTKVHYILMTWDMAVNIGDKMSKFMAPGKFKRMTISIRVET